MVGDCAGVGGADGARCSSALARPKSSTLTVPSGAQLDVGGLEIAMDDAAARARGQRVGDLARHRQRLVERQRALGDALGEGRPLDQLDDQAPAPARVLQAVDRPDVRMIEGGQHLRLAPEARQALGVGAVELGEDLQRDVAVELGVARPVDLAHAAGAERRLDLVGAEAGAGGEGHGGISQREQPLRQLAGVEPARLRRLAQRVRGREARATVGGEPLEVLNQLTQTLAGRPSGRGRRGRAGSRCRGSAPGRRRRGRATTRSSRQRAASLTIGSTMRSTSGAGSGASRRGWMPSSAIDRRVGPRPPPVFVAVEAAAVLGAEAAASRPACRARRRRQPVAEGLARMPAHLARRRRGRPRR